MTGSNSLVNLSGGKLSANFANSIFIPPTMTLGQDGAPVTQAELAFAWQISAVYLQYKINTYTSMLIDHLRDTGRKFVHDHSAFRTFFTKGDAEVSEIERILESGGTDAEKIAAMIPILAQEEAIARKFHILECLGYKPVQVLDLREGLNIGSFLFVHNGDPERNVLPQNVPALFLSFLYAEREKGETPAIIRRYTALERDVLTENDYANLAALKQGKTLSIEQANATVQNLARSQTRLWPIMSSAEYDTIVAGEMAMKKKLYVAAEVMVVGYLLNHATHRHQDLVEPANAERAFAAQAMMEELLGENGSIVNPMSFKAGDEHPSMVGKRNMQGNTRGFGVLTTFSDGNQRKVPHGFVEWAGWQPLRDKDGNPVIHAATGQVILAPVFDAGRTGKVFAKQLVVDALGSGTPTKALPYTPGSTPGSVSDTIPPKLSREMDGPEC